MSTPVAKEERKKQKRNKETIELLEKLLPQVGPAEVLGWIATGIIRTFDRVKRADTIERVIEKLMKEQPEKYGSFLDDMGKVFAEEEKERAEKTGYTVALANEEDAENYTQSELVPVEVEEPAKDS